MYASLLLVHSWARWLVLILLVVAIVNSIRGLAARASWIPNDNRISLWAVSATHLQFVLGLILYFISPVIQNAFADMGAAMTNKDLRFWAVEHLVGMIIAVVLVTIGRARVKRADTNIGKHRAQLLFFGFALLIILFSIPWASRPLLRLP